MDMREFSPLPAEFSELPPETAALPPEFGQTSGPLGYTAPKRHKRIKWLYAAAIVLFGIFIYGRQISQNVVPIEPVPANTVTPTPPPVDPTPASNGYVDVPGEPGDPEIIISDAIINRAASSDFSVVSYLYSVELNEMQGPVEVFAVVADASGKEAASETPENWPPGNNGEYRDIETTGLDSEKEMLLVLTGKFKKNGEMKEIVKTAVIKEPVFSEGPKINIEYAKCLKESSGKGDIYFMFTVDMNDVTGPVYVYPFIEDDQGYVKALSDEPMIFESNGETDELKISKGDLTDNMTLRISVSYDDAYGEVSKEAAEALVEVYEVPTIDGKVTYPLGDGKIVITVYNNSFDGDSANDPMFPYMKILAHEVFADEEFAAMDGYVIPEAYDPNEDWDAVGYVLHYGSEFDYGYSSETGEPFIKVLEGNVLTKEDVELVPPDGEGARYVNIHVMWLPLRNYDFKHRLELVLNDSTDDVEVFEADTPFASEGYTYLAVYGEPEREGYTFKGWYNEKGEKVEYLSYYDFVDLLPNAQSNEDRDWEHPKTIVLKAEWE